MTRYLTLDDVVAIHQLYGDGTRDLGLVEAAVARPQASAFLDDAYPTLALKAAALLHGLAKNHGFIDGNKRTAWIATVTFLYLNGFEVVVADQDDVVDLVLRVARAETSSEAGWIATEIEKIMVAIDVAP